MKSKYNSRQQKIFEDYNGFSTQKLMEYLENAAKYNSEVIEIIKEILAERKAIEEIPEVPIQQEEIEIGTGEKQRNGCITVYLILMIIMNCLIFLVYLVASEFIADNLPGDVSSGVIVLIGSLSLLNVFFAYNILKWKRWAFYGIVFVSMLMLIINLSIGVGIGQSILGLLGIAFLYGVLQAKKSNVSAWDQLE
jgi:hypothetical protein